jgi:hypothetical protein
MEEGDGLGYFLRRGIKADLLTIMIRELYCRRAEPSENSMAMRVEEAILQQMAAAQM